MPQNFPFFAAPYQKPCYQCCYQGCDCVYHLLGLLLCSFLVCFQMTQDGSNRLSIWIESTLLIDRNNFCLDQNDFGSIIILTVCSSWERNIILLDQVHSTNEKSKPGFIRPTPCAQNQIPHPLEDYDQHIPYPWEGKGFKCLGYT